MCHLFHFTTVLKHLAEPCVCQIVDGSIAVVSSNIRVEYKWHDNIQCDSAVICSSAELKLR